MKNAFWMALAAVLFANQATAQERIYRCGNEYTNTLPSDQTKGCKLVAGGNVTVVKGTRPNPPARAVASGASAASPRIVNAEQKARDSDARQILELELKKALQRQSELQQEYNNGQPEKLGSEARNFQRYSDRVAQLKASLERNESDIAGLRREIARQGQGQGAASVPAR